MSIKKKRISPKILSLTLSIALVLGIFSSITISDVFAASVGDTFVADNIKYEVTKIEAPAEVKIIAGTPEYTGVITIPEIVTDNDINYTVTDVDAIAFEYAVSLTHINTYNGAIATALESALIDYYRVDFDFKGVTPNAGTPSVQFVSSMGMPMAPITPSSATHTFDGWYMETELTNPWAPSTTVTVNIILFAKWTPKTFNITYNLGGGVEGTNPPTTYAYGTGATLVAPTKTDYDFVGWYDAETGGNAVTEITATASGDKTLWARWTLASAETPNFTTNLSGTDTYTQNDIATALTVEATGSGTITYQWYSNNANNNLSGSEIVGETNATYTPPTTAIGTVYYYVVATNTDSEATTTTATKASDVKTVVVNAPAPTTHAITYNNMEGATNPNPATYTEGIGLTLSSPTKASYTFDGWYDNSGFTGSAITSIGNSDTDAKEFWAKWQRTNAISPSFTANLSATAVTYTKNATATALTVTAPAPDEGTLSYQWYSNDTNNTDTPTAVGTNANTYTPPTTTVGTAYYYVVVTNTDTKAINTTASSTSNIATITVNDVALTNAVTPSFTANLSATEVQYTKDATTATNLTVTATVTDGGVLTYQWYSNDTNDTTTPTTVGTSTNTYKPLTTTVGTLYYYVVVTNTKADATGTKIATTTSNIAKITVTASATTNAVAPTFTANLSATEVQYTKDATTATNLTVTATVTDGGVLAYQWYSNDTNDTTTPTTVGTSTNTYKPITTTVGTLYYYVVVTNTKADATGTKTATATSNIAKITVKTATTTTTVPATPVTVLPAVVGSDAPKTMLQGDNDKITSAVLSTEEKTKLASGSKISVNLKVEKVTPPQADENAITLATNGKKIGLYLDLSLIKTIDGTASNITATNTPIKITIDIPEGFRKTGRVFSIMRSHNGVVTTLVDVDTDPNTITFETDKFSTYALAYADGTGATSTTNPQTNDNFPIIPVGVAVLVAIAVATFKRKRKSKA